MYLSILFISPKSVRRILSFNFILRLKPAIYLISQNKI